MSDDEDFLRMKSMVDDFCSQVGVKLHERCKFIREEYQNNPSNNPIRYYAIMCDLNKADPEITKLRKLRADTLAWYLRIHDRRDSVRNNNLFHYDEKEHPRHHATIAWAMLRRRK